MVEMVNHLRFEKGEVKPVRAVGSAPIQLVPTLLTEGLDAEQFNTTVGMLDKCEEIAQNVRLILNIGSTK